MQTRSADSPRQIGNIFPQKVFDFTRGAFLGGDFFCFKEGDYYLDEIFPPVFVSSWFRISCLISIYYITNSGFVSLRSVFSFYSYFRRGISLFPLSFLLGGFSRPKRTEENVEL